MHPRWCAGVLVYTVISLSAAGGASFRPITHDDILSVHRALWVGMELGSTEGNRRPSHSTG